jgi:iron complex transport system substrate-binding protein
MLYALGAGSRVAGVTTYCRYPPEAASKPKIGTYIRPDVETILSLRPDLVVAQKAVGNPSQRLSSLKLNTLLVDHDTIPGIFQSLESIGRAVGAEARAEALIRGIRDSVRARTAALPRRRVVFVVGRTPGRLENVIAVGKSSYLSEVIEIAGGANVFRDSIAAYPKVSLEELLARDPEVIVDMGEMAETAGVSEERKRAVVALWSRYPVLSAVKRGRVFAVASDIFVVPGPRVVEAVKAFAKMLHPEAGF